MTQTKTSETELIIIGAGAAGLMAGVRAGELGLSAVLLERKHLAGRKLLMCGNARCNITSDLTSDDMIRAYGSPVAEFLELAIKKFSPRELQQWLNRHGLATTIHQDQRVFPASEKASDVLRYFMSRLRELVVPVMFNCPVEDIVYDEADGWSIRARHCTFCSQQVLLATGGVSYPKTGSVGDGQKMAGKLGHRIIPYRAGLAGYEIQEDWLCSYADTGFPGAQLQIVGKNGKILGETSGEIRCERWGIVGPAVVNASRIAARRNLSEYTFLINLLPAFSRESLVEIMKNNAHLRAGDVERFVAEMGIPVNICDEFVMRNVRFDHSRIKGKAYRNYRHLAEVLQAWELHPVTTRPLKEAMVTVGGVALDQVCRETMESCRTPGLFFAGEVMDVDGPTGGYNLHAAFATARLAVDSVAARLDKNVADMPVDNRRKTHGGKRETRKKRRMGKPR